MTLAFLLALPVAGAGFCMWQRALSRHSVALLSTAVGHALLVGSMWVRGTSDATLGPLFAVDPLGLIVLSLSSLLFLVAAFSAVPYLLHATRDPKAAPRVFVPCLLWFLAAMTVVATTQHLALLWAAVEGTTLATAPLISFYRRRGALEAAWKYLILCSVGIAIALLGTFCLGVAADASGQPASLLVNDLRRLAPSMPRSWLVASFVLALVGYGTKMGLAPMHSWLPDAHSQAPSPVSALLSGVLLNGAFLGVLRFYQVTLAAGDARFAQDLLLALGVLSMIFGVGMMSQQRDYKRLFAYSSVENMGILALGAGLGPLALAGTLFHMINHSLAKGALFLLSGNILRRFGTTQAPEVRGLQEAIPATAVLLVTALFAIGGVPPFSPFWSELLVVRAAVVAQHPAIAALVLLLLASGFLAGIAVVMPMLRGKPSLTGPAAPLESWSSWLGPALLCGALFTLGFYYPGWLDRTLGSAVAQFLPPNR